MYRYYTHYPKLWNFKRVYLQLGQVFGKFKKIIVLSIKFEENSMAQEKGLKIPRASCPKCRKRYLAESDFSTPTERHKSNNTRDIEFARDKK